MKMDEVFTDTFTALRGQVAAMKAEGRRLWQLRLGTSSAFCQSVVGCGYLTAAQMQRAAHRYRLGTSRDGGVIFWQIDELDQLRDGKIMYYRADCHRDHDRQPTWAVYLLRRHGRLPKDWNAAHCLFGLHLIGQTADPAGWGTGRTVGTAADAGGGAVAVVESEKTAVIMSELQPGYTWLATGGKTELNVAKLKPLAGRRVILFPDTDTDGQTYRDWYDIAVAAGDVYGHPFTVSSLLERTATKSQRERKIDIVDLLCDNE